MQLPTLILMIDLQQGPSGFHRTGVFRARFIIEALHDLRARLRAAGSDLLVRIGQPEQVLPQLARELGAGRVYCHGGVAGEELLVEDAVQRRLGRQGAELAASWGGTLFHVEDLPCGMEGMPLSYGELFWCLCAVCDTLFIVEAYFDGPFLRCESGT